MKLSPELRIRLISWSAATALHVCAGALIFCDISWGDGAIEPYASHRSGVVRLTLTPSALTTPAVQSSAPSASTSVEGETPKAVPPSPALASATAVASVPHTAAGDQGPSIPRPAAATDLAGVDADRFRQAVLARIAQFKRYPPDAERDHLEGTVWVGFLVDRDGRLLDVWIDRSSGQRVLDDEALAAIKRAAPFPVIPTGLPDRIDLALGIPFTLG